MVIQDTSFHITVTCELCGKVGIDKYNYQVLWYSDSTAIRAVWLCNSCVVMLCERIVNNELTLAIGEPGRPRR